MPMNSGAREALIKAIAHSLQFDARPMSTSGEANHWADVALAALTEAGYELVKLPEPDDVGDWGSVWSIDRRYDGPIGTVQYRPETGRIEIRDDYERDYAPEDVRRDAAVLLAAVAKAKAE